MNERRSQQSGGLYQDSEVDFFLRPSSFVLRTFFFVLRPSYLQ